MQLGQIGRREYRRIALIGAMLAVGACQATGPLDRTAKSSDTPSKHAVTQPAAPIISAEPAAFIGLGDKELSRALGEPKQVRKDAPAQVWQYYGAECVVDFYLYDGDGGLTVTYLEARNATADVTPTDPCVKSLMQSVSAENTRKAL